MFDILNSVKSVITIIASLCHEYNAKKRTQKPKTYFTYIVKFEINIIPRNSLIQLLVHSFTF